jgi:hypothetical protein
MRVLAATTTSLMTMLIVVWGLLGRKQVGQVSPEANDHRYFEPFERSAVGNTVTKACRNCHSNQTILPWYGHIAPISWWVKSHVRKGREELNFSEWTKYSARRQRDELESICGVISNGRMPPAAYIALHPEARLNSHDKKTICAWTAEEVARKNHSSVGSIRNGCTEGGPRNARLRSSPIHHSQ